MTVQQDPRTYERLLVSRSVKIASKLEQLAQEIREQGRAFSSSKVDAPTVAGEITSLFVQGTGSLGAFLSGLVTDAARLDRARNEEG